MEPTQKDLARVKSYYLDGVCAANRGIVVNPYVPASLAAFAWGKGNRDCRMSYEAIYTAYYAD